MQFTDIVKRRGEVTIDSGTFKTQGVELEQIADMFMRFPTLQNLFDEKKRASVGRAEIIAMAPDALAAFIAAGTGCYGDEAQEKAIAENLNLEEKIEFLDNILGLTTPKGVVPFVQRLQAFAGRAAVVKGAPKAEEGAEEAESPDSSKAPATT